jgi:hypothetical protein
MPREGLSNLRPTKHLDDSIMLSSAEFPQATHFFGF